MSLTSKLAKKLSLVTLWISMGFSTLSAQQIFWDFNDGTTTDLTLQNIAVFTGNGTGEGAGGGGNDGDARADGDRAGGRDGDGGARSWLPRFLRPRPGPV